MGKNGCLSFVLKCLATDQFRLGTLITSTQDVRGEHTIIDLLNSRLPSDTPLRDGYNPRKLRTPATPITKWMAYSNMMRTVFGAGFLTLPLAISQIGYIPGIFLMVFTGLLLLHAHLCLLWCLNETARQLRIPYVNYRYSFRLTLLHGPECLARLAEHGPCLVAFMMVMGQLGICTVFVIFTADILKDMADFDSMSTALAYLVLPYLLMALAAKDLKMISYASALGNITDLIGLILTVIQIFLDPHGSMSPVIMSPLHMLIAFGTMLFNMSSVGVILNIDRSLKDPYVLLGKTGIISVCTITATVAGTTFGILAYWSFGTIESNVLMSLPYDQVLSMWALGMYLVSIVLTFPLQCYPGLYIIMQVVRDRHLESPANQDFMNIVDVVTRLCFVFASFFISYLIPFQGAFVALVGNLCTALLAIVFPAYMELSLRYPNNYGRLNIYLIKNLFVIIIAFITLTFGLFMIGNNIYIKVLSN